MKKKYIILICIAVLLIAIRILLPYIVLHYANKTLANVKGYYGNIVDIDLSIFRGAYIIKEIHLNKIDSISKKQTPFFKSKDIDLSIEWAALFNGSIVGELIFDTPVLIFTKDKIELGDVKKDTTDFRNLLKAFMPLKVNRFEVNNGNIHYADNTGAPKVDVALMNTHILALNLTNVKYNNVVLPSIVSARAEVYEGTLEFNMKMDLMLKNATFDLNAEIKNRNLVLLNDFFKAYGKFDVNKGNFGLYTEMATKDGKFKGYVKPIINDLDVVGAEDRKDSFFNKIWESVVGVGGVVFKNQKKDQLATKIDIEGSFKNPEISIIDAILEVLRNAFVQALMPSVDNEININSVNNTISEKKKNLIEQIFTSDKKSEVKKNK